MSIETLVYVLALILCDELLYAKKAGVLTPTAAAKVLSPLKKVVASLVPDAVSLASETVLSDGVPIVLEQGDAIKLTGLNVRILISIMEIT